MFDPSNLIALHKSCTNGLNDSLISFHNPGAKIYALHNIFMYGMDTEVIVLGNTTHENGK